VRALHTESLTETPEVCRVIYGAGMRIAVVGAHLGGEPLNHQLTDRGARLAAVTRTAPVYRLFALDTDPPKPGLVRVGKHAAGVGSVEVEVWELEPSQFASFVDAVPAPLCIGRVVLSDGSDVAGFLCEPIAAEGAADITAYGGWRAYRSVPRSLRASDRTTPAR
jgi:allophanate hydrolase